MKAIIRWTRTPTMERIEESCAVWNKNERVKPLPISQAWDKSTAIID
jgi:hypothetical protein